VVVTRAALTSAPAAVDPAPAAKVAVVGPPLHSVVSSGSLDADALGVLVLLETVAAPPDDEPEAIQLGGGPAAGVDDASCNGDGESVVVPVPVPVPVLPVATSCVAAVDSAHSPAGLTPSVSAALVEVALLDLGSVAPVWMRACVADRTRLVRMDVCTGLAW
jgi:hypothetical protein